MSLHISFLETNFSAYVVDTSSEAARLFNVSARHLIGRNLLIFFTGARQSVAMAVAQAVVGLSPEPITAMLQPRERRPRQVRVTVSPRPDGRVAWTIEAFMQPSSLEAAASLLDGGSGPLQPNTLGATTTPGPEKY